MTRLDNSELILGSPVARGLAEIGDRWVALILRDVFLGVRRFEVLRRRSGATRGTLTSRLKRLVKSNILTRNPYQQSPPRFEYRLAPKGLDLYPFILSVWDWESRWGADDCIPPQLIHAGCGQPTRPRIQCGGCHLPLCLREVAFEPRDNPLREAAETVWSQRRSPTRPASPRGVDRLFFHILDIIGDRWTGLVVAAMFFGLSRYDEIASALGISTNVLADRLKMLSRVDVITRTPYQQAPTRFAYRLTTKGEELYPLALLLHEWAERWLLAREQSPLTLQHKPCGKPVRTEVVCSQCQESLTVHHVNFDPASLTQTH